MFSTFSLAVQQCIGVRRGKFFCQKFIAPKQKISSIFPGKSTQGILQTDIHVHEIVERQCPANNFSTELDVCKRKLQIDPVFLEEAYERCRKICAEYAKTYYLAWCKRTDELVDGSNSFCTSSADLDRWEERLQQIFDGNPYDMLDAALTDTVFNFHLHVKPFGDMIKGMRMDTSKCRYENFEELYLYCYYAGGTVGLMSVPVMGFAPNSSASAQIIYIQFSSLFGRWKSIDRHCQRRGRGVSFLNSLSFNSLWIWDLLVTIPSSASRGRVYLPQEELEEFGLSDRNVFSGKVTDKWREFMKEQITRARHFYNLAEEGASHLERASRWPVRSVLILYQQMLDAIEGNDYDNLTKRAYVGRIEKLALLPQAYNRVLSVFFHYK